MTATPHNPPERDPVRETLNEVWRDAYETDAAMAFDDFRCCARIKSLADDRKCWMSNAKVLQKKLNELEKPADISPPYDPDKVFASFVVGGSIILAAIGFAVALFIHS